MLFDFLDMVDDYEIRKIGCWKDEERGLFVSTAAVFDSDQPYETAIEHPDYHDRLIIVEMYESREKAKEGHEKWVKKLQEDDLPETIEDVSTSTAAEFCRAFGNSLKFTRKK